MLRAARMKWDKRGDMLFRWRGDEVTRLEGFTDAVFGFALTLLVVSLEVPRSFDDLMRTMRGFLAFAICFAMLLNVWEKHYRFFRRFGLQDGITLAINGGLLFVVVFYVYPLKFVMTSFIDGLVFKQETLTIREDQVGQLFAIYGMGFAAVFFLFAALYAYAWKRRDALELDVLERYLTRGEIGRNLLLGGLGLISIALGLALPIRSRGIAGFVYMLVGAIETWHGNRASKGLKLLETETASAP
jgi:uncharacterized membrane protein